MDPLICEAGRFTDLIEKPCVCVSTRSSLALLCLLLSSGGLLLIFCSLRCFRRFVEYQKFLMLLSVLE